MWDKIKGAFAIIGAVALLALAAILGGKPKRKLRESAQRVRDSIGDNDRRAAEAVATEQELGELSERSIDLSANSAAADKRARQLIEGNRDFLQRVRERSRKDDPNGED